MFQLTVNAMKPYLAGDDLFEVAQALSDIIINGAATTSALLDVLARRVPVLNLIGSQWIHVAVRSWLSARAFCARFLATGIVRRATTTAKQGTECRIGFIYKSLHPNRK